MKHIKEGDFVTVCWTIDEKGKIISGTALHVPQDNLWYVDDGQNIIAFSSCSKNFDYITKRKERKAVNKMTKEEAYELHYKMWDWLAHNPGKNKAEWPQWEWNGGKIKHVGGLCFLCIIYENCIDCPLKDCNDLEGLFQLWTGSCLSSKERQEYALKIRDVVKRSEQNECNSCTGNNNLL